MPSSRGMSGDNRNRTRDLFGANEALYLLSYVPMSVTPGDPVATRTGRELNPDLGVPLRGLTPIGLHGREDAPIRPPWSLRDSNP